MDTKKAEITIYEEQNGYTITFIAAEDALTYVAMTAKDTADIVGKLLAQNCDGEY